jgi:hypothetical protein
VAVLNALIARVMGSLQPADGIIPASVYRILLPYEHCRITMRQHPAVLGGPLLLSVGWLLGAGIANQFIPTGSSYYPVLIIWATWLAVLLRLFIRIYGWMDSYLVFSDLHLFVVSGVFVKTVQSFPLSTISDASFSKSPAGRLFDYGRFVFEVGGADRVIVPFDYIPYPEEFSIEMRAVIFPDESAAAESSTEEGEPGAED